MTTPEFIESLCRLSVELDDIQFSITKMEATLEHCKESVTNLPSDPEATRYKVGKDYWVSDDERGWLTRKYAGYIDSQHWFREDNETLGSFAFIKEIAKRPDPRIGKVCVFSNEPDFSIEKGITTDRLEKIHYGVYTAARSGMDFMHCMLLTDYVKMIEDGK